MRQACGIETHGLAYRPKFLLSHIHDYVTYAAHGRQYLIEVYVVR